MFGISWYPNVTALRHPGPSAPAEPVPDKADYPVRTPGLKRSALLERLEAKRARDAVAVTSSAVPQERRVIDLD